MRAGGVARGGRSLSLLFKKGYCSRRVGAERGGKESAAADDGYETSRPAMKSWMTARMALAARGSLTRALTAAKGVSSPPPQSSGSAPAVRMSVTCSTWPLLMAASSGVAFLTLYQALVAAVAQVDVGAELEQQLDLLFTRPLDTLAGDKGVRLLALPMERIAKRHATLDEERNDLAR